MAHDARMEIDEIWFTAKREMPDLLSTGADVDWAWVDDFMGWTKQGKYRKSSGKR